MFLVSEIRLDNEEIFLFIFHHNGPTHRTNFLKNVQKYITIILQYSRHNNLILIHEMNSTLRLYKKNINAQTWNVFQMNTIVGMNKQKTSKYLKIFGGFRNQ